MATIRQRAPLMAGTGSVTTSVQVNPLPPVFTVSPTSATYSLVSLPQTLQFTATDPNGQSVSYGLVTAPSGYSINSSSGLVTVAVGASSQSFRVRATDAGGLYTDSATCTVTIAQPASATFKWNPGFYISLWQGGHADSAAARLANKSFMDQFANDSRIKGFYLKKHWNVYEGAQGNYAAGFDMVDYYLGLCAGYAVKKRLMIGVECYGVNRDPTPAYLSAYSYQPPGWTGWYLTRIDQSACMDRYLALVQAFASRYDGHALVEMFDLGDEPSLPFPSLAIGSPFDVQYQRLLSTGKTYWTSTLTRAQISYYGNTASDALTRLPTLTGYNTDGSAGCLIFGGPDHEYGLSGSLTDPSDDLPMLRLWRGDVTSSNPTVGPWQDVRGIQPWVGESQERGRIDPRYPMDTVGNVIAFHRQTMQASHVTLFDYVQWSDTWSVIQGLNGVTNPTPPSLLTGRTVTGAT